jgi:hypothetical protein
MAPIVKQIRHQNRLSKIIYYSSLIFILDYNLNDPRLPSYKAYMPGGQVLGAQIDIKRLHSAMD